MLLKDRIAIVTGASRGIGREIALTLARNGASLVINGSREDLLLAIAAEVQALGQKCVIQAAQEHFGRIDILVNNAGINMRSPSLEMKIDDWKRVLDVNLNGTLYCCLAVLPQMIQQQYGKIVNVSSTTAKTPHRNAAPSYGASKAAVNYLTQHLALEMAPQGIYVNAVCPGPVETDMTAEWPPSYRAQVLSRVPLGKLGSTNNVADVVLFLASPMSNFVTGETININGGTYMN